MDQKEADLEEELTRLKGQYGKRIKEQEARMQQEMEEFINGNKESHTSKIDEIKQIKETYEARLKKMNSSLQELQQQKLKEYDEKYKRWLEGQMGEIDESNRQKLDNAEIKIKGDVEGKMEKIKKEIVKILAKTSGYIF